MELTDTVLREWRKSKASRETGYDDALKESTRMYELYSLIEKDEKPDLTLAEALIIWKVCGIFEDT